jgi:hypothetical protein
VFSNLEMQQVPEKNAAVNWKKAPVSNLLFKLWLKEK